MHKVQVWVELPDEKFRAYVSESLRQGVTVESLVERSVQLMLRDSLEAERDGTDHPVFLE
jgi:hypothetical protein